MFAPQPATETARTRLPQIGGYGKSVYVMSTFLVLSIIGAIAAGSYSQGATVHIESNAPGIAVHIDPDTTTAGPFGLPTATGATRTTDATGNVEFQHLPVGTRQVKIASRDYEAFSTPIRVGWFSRNHFSLVLKAIPLALRIDTMPEAEVKLNGKSLGNSNNAGTFVAQGVLPGDYVIEVSHPGFTSFREKHHLSPPAQRFYAYLSISAERQRQIQEEQRQAVENAGKVQQLLVAARQQFNARQYSTALSSVDEALRLQPTNGSAQQLKNQITQVMSILK